MSSKVKITGRRINMRRDLIWLLASQQDRLSPLRKTVSEFLINSSRGLIAGGMEGELVMVMVSHPFCGLMSQTLGTCLSGGSRASFIDLKPAHHLGFQNNYLAMLNPIKIVLFWETQRCKCGPACRDHPFKQTCFCMYIWGQCFVSHEMSSPWSGILYGDLHSHPSLKLVPGRGGKWWRWGDCGGAGSFVWVGVGQHPIARTIADPQGFSSGRLWRKLVCGHVDFFRLPWAWPQALWLPIEMCSVTVPEARSPKSRCHQGCPPLKAVGAPPLPLSWLLCSPFTLDTLGPVGSSLPSLLPLCGSVFVQPLLIRTPTLD